MHATSLMLGKLSGRHAFRDKLEAMGYTLAEAAFEQPSGASRTWPTRKHVFDEDIMALVDDEIMRGQDAISVKQLRVESGTGIQPVSALTLLVRWRSGASPPRVTARWTPFSRRSRRFIPTPRPCSCSRSTPSPRARTPRPR